MRKTISVSFSFLSLKRCRKTFFVYTDNGNLHRYRSPAQYQRNYNDVNTMASNDEFAQNRQNLTSGPVPVYRQQHIHPSLPQQQHIYPSNQCQSANQFQNPPFILTIKNNTNNNGYTQNMNTNADYRSYRSDNYAAPTSYPHPQSHIPGIFFFVYLWSQRLTKTVFTYR